MTIKFKVKKLTESAKLPEQANEGDLYDLFADNFSVDNFECVKTKTKVIFSKEDSSCELLVGARVLVKTGIAIELPKIYSMQSMDMDYSYNIGRIWKFEDEIIEPWEDLEGYGTAHICSRSGLALKHGVVVLNAPGIIDNSYRKEIGVILHNTGNAPYIIKKGDKIAQMSIQDLACSSFEEVKDFSSKDERGGFGSTGK